MTQNRHKSSPANAQALLLFTLLLIGSLGLSGEARAFHLPLWEAGVGLGVVSVPHYRGSETEADLALPFPYIIYRGEVFRVDREEGVRGRLFKSEAVDFDLSLAGSIPVPDTDEGAREDMPGLDPLIEAGAELTVSLWRAAERDHSMQFVTPFRFVYSVGDPLIKYQGWTFSPYLNYRVRQRSKGTLTRWNLSFGPIYADRDYHSYFYQVRPKFVTAEREAYEAERGYSGSRITLSVSRNTKKYTLGAFARYDNLEGAVFEDSPLVETRDYFAFGFAFGWIFGTSKTYVQHERGDRPPRHDPE